MLFSTYKDFLVFATKNGLLFYKDAEEFWTHEIKFDLPCCSQKPLKFLEYEDENQENEEIELAQGTENKIELLSVSEDKNLLAVITSDKTLHLFEILEKSLKFLSRRKIYRTGSNLRFFNKSSELFMADKTGECFVFDCKDHQKVGKWILGHMSQVLCTEITADDEYIITGDRDEKIRVTSKTEAPEIQTVCLGHQEFVTVLKLIEANDKDSNLLLSLSGDKSLRVWDFLKGTSILVTELSYVGIAAASLTINKANFLAIKSDTNQLFIYKRIVDGNSFEFKLLLQKQYPSEFEMVARTNYFLFSHISDDLQVVLEKCLLSEDVAEDCSIDRVCCINEITKIETKSFDTGTKHDLSIMYKKKFENARDFIESKRQKLEDRSK